MLKIIQHFGKYCTFHLQGVMVWCIWQHYIGQAVGEELDDGATAYVSAPPISTIC
jgi:hypothetical protein